MGGGVPEVRVVADYFVQKQRNGDYVPGREKLQHVEAVLQLLSVMTEDTRFEEVLNQDDGSDQGGVNNMCDVLDRVEARGVAIGEARGVAIGEARGESKLASLMDKLFALNRFDDAKKAAKDEKYRAGLFAEFKIQ